MPHPNYKLGKRAPRLDKRTLRLAKYLRPAALPTPPAEVSWFTKVPSWPMLLNDQLGDCVIAAALHMVQQWNFYAGRSYMPTDSEALAGYEAVGGYVPNDPTTDNGCAMLTALNYWRQTGFAGHKILAYAAVNPKNLLEVQQAIMLFGNLYIGLDLPISAQGQNAWTVPDGGPFQDGSPGSWGGHCIPLVAGSPITFPGISWGGVYRQSHNFFLDYCSEAYAVLSQEWIEANGKSPGGVDLSLLKSDVALVTA